MALMTPTFLTSNVARPLSAAKSNGLDTSRSQRGLCCRQLNGFATRVCHTAYTRNVCAIPALFLRLLPVNPEPRSQLPKSQCLLKNQQFSNADTSKSLLPAHNYRPKLANAPVQLISYWVIASFRCGTPLFLHPLPR